jgi:hypothetical protein
VLSRHSLRRITVRTARARAARPNAMADLNRLYSLTRWNRLHQRYVRLDDGS